jgi:hypothetical protein
MYEDNAKIDVPQNHGQRHAANYIKQLNNLGYFYAVW